MWRWLRFPECRRACRLSGCCAFWLGLGWKWGSSQAEPGPGGGVSASQEHQSEPPAAWRGGGWRGPTLRPPAPRRGSAAPRRERGEAHSFRISGPGCTRWGTGRGAYGRGPESGSSGVHGPTWSPAFPFQAVSKGACATQPLIEVSSLSFRSFQFAPVKQVFQYLGVPEPLLLCWLRLFGSALQSGPPCARRLPRGLAACRSRKF